ncbi:hypothetical protein V6582_01715 (plasmid) [Agrobacterium vitis]|uniref:hypothetical protein n=1 Tax=Agrobacterium vitis TaxID=373 RepID=UPI0012E761A6|nr:hypothetical protein [Agrobacterium vitis]MVA27581.1 hypothetical protein [Agrobacterium vitis]
MQISQLYSNLPDILSPIVFNHGADASRLNVVLGEVKHPKDRKKDSHNLGKTTLLHLIDFLMLKGWSQDSFLYRHRDRFADFVFYLEIALNSGGYATIRRSVSAPTRVALSRHDTPKADFNDVADDAWDHPDLPIDEAIKLLDAWLDLRALKPYDYRKAITYFLRAQGDWSDELQLQKFQAGRDLYWKPFVAHLFGFNQTPIVRKYELDELIQKLQEKQGEQQAEVQFREEDLPKLVAELGVLHQQVDDLEEQLDAFRFDDEERRIMRDLVETIESDIAELNQQIYNARYDIGQIDSSLSHKDKFDLDEVQSIFTEAQLHFPAQLKKQYGELVEFKKKSRMSVMRRCVSGVRIWKPSSPLRRNERRPLTTGVCNGSSFSDRRTPSISSKSCRRMSRASGPSSSTWRSSARSLKSLSKLASRHERSESVRLLRTYPELKSV